MSVIGRGNACGHGYACSVDGEAYRSRLRGERSNGRGTEHGHRLANRKIRGDRVPESGDKRLEGPSMSVKKVDRKGKLDHDLPFRSRQTFAIFPNRSRGWGKYAVSRCSDNREIALTTSNLGGQGDTHLTRPGTHVNPQVSNAVYLRPARLNDQLLKPAPGLGAGA